MRREAQLRVDMARPGWSGPPGQEGLAVLTGISMITSYAAGPFGARGTFSPHHRSAAGYVTPFTFNSLQGIYEDPWRRTREFS
jgi:hypothetical protein